MWGYRLINYSCKNNLKEIKRLAQLQFSIKVEKGIWDKLRKENKVGEYDFFLVNCDQWEMN